MRITLKTTGEQNTYDVFFHPETNVDQVMLQYCIVGDRRMHIYAISHTIDKITRRVEDSPMGCQVSLNEYIRCRYNLNTLYAFHNTRPEDFNHKVFCTSKLNTTIKYYSEVKPLVASWVCTDEEIMIFLAYASYRARAANPKHDVPHLQEAEAFAADLAAAQRMDKIDTFIDIYENKDI
jgi:hypothetical protein